jgi:hypothetical protein
MNDKRRAVVIRICFLVLLVLNLITAVINGLEYRKETYAAPVQKTQLGTVTVEHEDRSLDAQMYCLQLQRMLWAQRPEMPQEGTVRVFIDGTVKSGKMITGGGAYRDLCIFDGKDWIVVANTVGGVVSDEH